MDKSGEGVSRFFAKNFCLSAEKLLWGTLRCIRKFRTSQNFMHKKGISLNSVENLCLLVPIKFVGEPFWVSKKFWYRKISTKGEGSFTVLSKFFLSHRTERTSPGNHSVFQKISGREKYFMDKRGGGIIKIFRRKFLSHRTEIFHWRTLWCFRKILLSKIFMHRRGRGITVLSKFFVSQDRNEKLCKGTLLFSGNFLVSKKFMDKKVLITIFRRSFCLTVPKYFIGEHFGVSENIFYRKFSCIGGAVASRF